MLIFFFFRSNNHTYGKTYVDALFLDVIYDKCNVSLTQLTAEDIENHKL